MSARACDPSAARPARVPGRAGEPRRGRGGIPPGTITATRAGGERAGERRGPAGARRWSLRPGEAARVGAVGCRWRSARGATVRPPPAPALDAVLTASVSGGRVALVTDAEGLLFVVGAASAGCPRLERNLGEDLSQLRKHAPEIRAAAGERAPCSLLPPLGTRDAGVLWNLFPESSAAC